MLLIIIITIIIMIIAGLIWLNTGKLTRSRHGKDWQIDSSFLILRVPICRSAAVFDKHTNAPMSLAASSAPSLEASEVTNDRRKT